MFPDVCVQSILKPNKWWVEDKSYKLSRGALVLAFVPHVDQVPMTFEPVGRSKATEHDSAIVKVAPLKVDQPLKPTDLPVAAMTVKDGEVWAAYRAKRRPCLVLGCESPKVDPAVVRGTPNNSTAPTCLVAPYYGAKRTTDRAGYPEAFVERVRQCEYPQFLWDHLPHVSGEESLLRLDHLQPIGTHHHAFKPLGYKLSADALALVDEILDWLFLGGVDPDGLIAYYRKEIESC